MKKTTIAIAAASLVASGLFSACRFTCVKGKGAETTQTFKLGEFSKIDIEGGYNVVLKQDSSEVVTLTANENLFDYIRVVNSGGKLRVYSRKSLCTDHAMTLHIGVKHLSLIRTAGGINLNTDGKLVTGDLKLDLSGATKGTLNLNAANLETDGSGATELNLSGQASTHKVDLTGSGKLHAFDLVVGKYSIETTGAGECEVNVLNELNTNTTGASTIKYKGNPTTVHNDKTGASSIEKVQ